VRKLFVRARTKATAVIMAVLPVLLVAFGYYHGHRSPVNVVGKRTFWDYVILNSDILLGLVFLAACSIPFVLVFDRKKPKPRDMIPMAVMAAIGVVGRTVFAVIPLPNFKPVSAIVIITGVAFGPEAGFMTGALTGFVSNFIFGQGPWTPWQMFSWGLIGFIAGLLQNGGFFAGGSKRERFTSPIWQRLCPANTNRGDLLYFARRIADKAPVRLCMYGLITGFLYGWIMNLFFIVGYISPITWQTVGAAYVSSFTFDLSHGVCTFLVLWTLGEPWIKKLERVKVKFGLVAEEQNCALPPPEGPSYTEFGAMEEEAW
jgi:energy-coupling factor transport system substrate-specific component